MSENFKGAQKSDIEIRHRAAVGTGSGLVSLLPDTLQPFAWLIERAERGMLDTGPLLLFVDKTRTISTHNANRVVRQAVAATLADPQAWRVIGCAQVLYRVQQALTLNCRSSLPTTLGPCGPIQQLPQRKEQEKQ